jgi:hypothetical protein
MRRLADTIGRLEQDLKPGASAGSEVGPVGAGYVTTLRDVDRREETRTELQDVCGQFERQGEMNPTDGSNGRP